ncbi:MAG: IMP dehydrogenase [Bdellovibrio sp.]|nr:IMP dehydrogenase [Bdellovibrio sp.]
MELIFRRDGILKRGKGMTFDDLLLVPQYSEISSRKGPVLEAQVTKNWRLQIPIITANMDTITEGEMAIAMGKLGGLGIIHRFMSPESQVEEIKKVRKSFEQYKINLPIAASIGVKEEGMSRADLLAQAGVDILTVDIAHGDSILMIETLNYVKRKYPKIDVIAGNVASGDSVKRLVDAGADCIKVGIGPGSMCTTRIITGHGVPQLTAIALSVETAKRYKIPVIADGGLKNSGDIVKALAAGADTVMIGSMAAGTLETPGEMKSGKKVYRGMASKDAQVSWRGELPRGMAAEGEATLVPCKGPVENVILELTGGLRSGMTYMGVHTIEDMHEKALFMEMSAAGLYESRPHGVRN